MVYGQNGIGQNGTDKMVRTKWYGQNDTDKMIRIKRYRWNHQSIYQSRSHWQCDFFINPASTLTSLGFLCVFITFCDFCLLIKNWIHLNYNLFRKFATICSVPFCPYHSGRTILFIRFCSYHFIRYHFVRSISLNWLQCWIYTAGCNSVLS